MGVADGRGRRVLGPGRSVPCAGRLCQSIIEATTTDTALGDEAISAPDQQFLDAATVLGSSDGCIGGAQG